MQKVFVKSNQIEGDNIIIEGDDFNHITRVLRMHVGEEIIANSYLCKISQINKNNIVLNIVDELESTEPNVTLDIYQGLPKFDKLELIIQKTVEIGAHSIIPVKMQRSIVKYNDINKKLERWNKISESAAQQSKRDIIPTVESVIDIDEVCNRIGDYDLFLVAYEDENDLFVGSVLRDSEQEPDKNNKIGILIGPEGGIDSSEIEKLKNAGAKIVTLGKRILRTETAPIYLASIIMYEYSYRKRRNK